VRRPKHVTGSPALTWVGRSLLPLLALVPLLPSAGAAQSWELHLGRMAIDHQPPVPDSRGDRLPAGIALNVRYVWSWGTTLGMEISRGMQTRSGSVCYGLVADPSECIVEPVENRGGLTALFLGWRVAARIGSHWSLGLHPRIGLGRITVLERGDDTGRTASQAKSTLVLGATGEVRYDVPGSRLGLIASTGLDQLRPLGLERCEDCYDVIRDPMPQWTFGLGLAWTIR
jgi:hypothetical protein